MSPEDLQKAGLDQLGKKWSEEPLISIDEKGNLDAIV
jgi:hypothetical protein